jgi:Putative metal-binding motif
MDPEVPMTRIGTLLAATALFLGCGQDGGMGDGGDDGSGMDDLSGTMDAKAGDQAVPIDMTGSNSDGMGGNLDGMGGGTDGDAGNAKAVAIIQITPSAASRNLATTLNLTGYGFDAGAKVTLTSCADPNVKIDLGIAMVGMNGTVATVSLPADANRLQGYYTVTITNPDGTSATLPCSLLISALSPPTVTKVQPGSAYQGKQGDGVLSDQAVTVTGTGFIATPDVVLRNKNSGVVFHAISVSWLSSTSLTAVVPSESQGMAVGDYDFSVINPNLLAGTWGMPFKITSTPPPVITAINPVSGSSANCPITVTLTGTGFVNGMTFAMIVPPGTNCPNGSQPGVDVQGNNTCSGTVSMVNMAGTSATVILPCLGLGLYPLEVVNPDSQYGLFFSFAYTPSSGGHFNGGTGWEVGPDPINLPNVLFPTLNVPRWRHGFQYGFDQFGDTWLFAAGGQGTLTGPPLATVEITQINVFGVPGTWATSQQFKSAMQPRVDNTLGGLTTPQGRTGLELLRVGRFLYAIGGANVNTNDQTVYNEAVNPGDKGILRTVERAEILGYDTMPLAQKPTWKSGNGLPLGTWYYRVSGVSASGESLPSTAMIAQNADGVIHVQWAKPISGMPTSYNVYRSLAADGRANTERLLATGVMANSFDDTGTGPLTPAPGRLQGNVLAGGMLPVGTVSYRVSACPGMMCNDNDRSTETLAGYPAEVVTDANRKTVSLTWNPIPNSTYRVFKLNPNTKKYEQIAKDVTDGMKPWKDDGSIAFPMNPIYPKDGIAPLPVGSISTWTTLPQKLVKPREGLDGLTLSLAGGGAALYVGGGRASTAPNVAYHKTLEDAIVDPKTGDITVAWKEQTNHPFTNSRAFFALLTTQDRDITPVPPPPQEPPCPDFDGDGFQACYCYKGMDMMCGTLACDCNDNDAGIHPCAADICGDNIAQDCIMDHPCPMGCQMPDVDGDGHKQYICGGDDCCDTGAEGMVFDPMKKVGGTLGCGMGTAKGIHPGAVEICGNKIDEDCDGLDPPCMMNCMDDKDMDGYIACTCYPNGPPGTVTCAVNGVNVTIGKCDCNDNDPKIFPCAPDLVPCDGIAQNCIADICIIGDQNPNPPWSPLTKPKASEMSCQMGPPESPVPAYLRPGWTRYANNPTEWLVAVDGGNLMGASANGQQNAASQQTIEACAVDVMTADLIKCDVMATMNAPWAVQGPNTQGSEMGLDGVLYAAGGSPFLITWPGAKSEVLNAAPTDDNGTASRFDIDATNMAGVMTADPAKVVLNYQSNSSKFVLRSYYRMVRVDSYVYVLGGYTANGITGAIERHQQ